MFPVLSAMEKKARLDVLAHVPRFVVGLQTPFNSTAGLRELVEGLPKLDRVVELGSHRGVSTEVFAILCGSVTSIDFFGDRSILAMYLQFAHRYPNVGYIPGHSRWEAQRFADASIDLVYVDADHEREACRKDIEAWIPKVKPGCWIAGHDYTEEQANGGVIKAVADVFGKPDKVFPDSSWLVRLK